jgi:hypothetical protein
MSNSFTTTIYNEITSDLNLPTFKNNKNVASIFLKQQGGRGSSGYNANNQDSDINNLLSMLTTETSLSTTETVNLENRLKNTMQTGGAISLTSSDNYSNLFLSKNEIPLSATSVSQTSSVMPGINMLSETSF